MLIVSNTAVRTSKRDWGRMSGDTLLRWGSGKGNLLAMVVWPYGGRRYVRRYIIGILMNLAGLAGATAVSAQAPSVTPSVTAFVDVSVIPMDRERVLAQQTVLVEGGRILAVGPVGQVRVPASATRIDGKGKYLLPGLTDMHVHVHDPSTAFQFLAAGATTVRDMLASEETLELKREIATGKIIGPRIYTAAQVPRTCTLEQLTSCVADMKAAGYDFIKFYESIDLEGQTRPSERAARLAYDRELFDSLVAAAGQVGMRISGHMQTIGIEWALRARVASAEHAYGYFEYAANGHDCSRLGTDTTVYPLDTAKLSEIAVATRHASTWVVPTLAVFVTMEKRGGPAQVSPISPKGLWAMRECDRNNLQIVKALHDNGVGLLLGTDAVQDFLIENPPFVPDAAIPAELEQLVAAGLTPYQALEAGTRSAAVFLGTLDRSGTVEVGKNADLLLLNANPLENITNVAGAAGVMIGGRWLSKTDIAAQLRANPQP